MLNITLFEPEIPPNTGNIIRLCANTGTQLNLIEPLGFDIDDKRLRRAGLDYHEFANIHKYKSYQDYMEGIDRGGRVFACSTKGTKGYHEVDYKDGDSFLFGPETRGLPDDILKSIPCDQIIRIPMRPESRSLNLSNSVAIILLEGLRQLNFPGAV
jgi:tRNA (cytidine/uridine-2'-O-)-methyltransferase